MNYKLSFSEAKSFNKFGVDISAYPLNLTSFDFVYENVTEGHFEEFYSEVSTYTWFIFEGKGTFVVDDESINVVGLDVVSVPPKHRIHYFGKMKMLLMVTPKFDEKNEHHVRDVDKSESPY